MDGLNQNKNVMIEKKDVTGPLSFDYIRSQLSLGRSLSHMLNTMPIEKGKVFSFVPADTSKEKLYDFSSGGIYLFDKEILKTTKIVPVRNDSKPLVIDEIITHINADKMNCCIFEDPNAMPKDPFHGVEFLNFNNEEVYYFFDQGNVQYQEIKKAFIFSEAYIFLCILSSLELDIRITHESGFITGSLLELLVEGVNSFFVRAYDGEGYLLWNKWQ
jgi:hypothetical protein